MGVGAVDVIILAKGELRLECKPQYGSLRLAHNTSLLTKIVQMVG